MKLDRLLVLGCLSPLALALATAGCRDTTPSSTTMTTGASSDAGAAMPYATQTPGPMATTTAATPTTTTMKEDQILTDAQILQVTHTANSGEVAQGKLAQEKAKDPRVKKLAAMMVSDHDDADKKGASLAKKEGLDLTDSTTATTLKTDAERLTDDIRAKTGNDFDKAYIEAQVREHQAVLDTIDGKLMPNVKDSDVKSYLADVRPKIEAHLKHAQKLQSDLAK